jgi:hypothetical protein
MQHQQMHIIIVYYLQLKYYSSNMYRPSSCHLQGVHVSYVYDMDFV